jgi:RNA polymerase sigma factor (sigma-70 family)
MDIGRMSLSSRWVVSAAHEERLYQTIEQQGVQVTFDHLYQHYYPRVLAFLRFRIGSPEAAEDLTSVVFERALLHLSELQALDAAGAWLFRVARNCAADYFRRRQVEVSLDLLIDGDHPRVNSPEEIALAEEEQVLLLNQLQRLSDREREIIGLKFVARLRNRDIARILHLPEGTVSSILYRALARLRDALRREMRL